ncbi:retrovirus-related Pol polyprotein from transposon TNT 1-94 [Trichonephila clavipes]|nr:retrovirus-related Pol polyprotein from transposon TNT 1-94 [Trichonephila clavipes]
MEFNSQISVLTQNNWNTWKHDMQVILMHYGCWQFIIQTKPEQPDEETTYKEKLDLQLRKDRCYTLIYTNISSDLKNLITETTDGVAAWKILKDHFEPVTRARIIQLLDNFFGKRYQPGEDVGIFISRVKTAATRLQEAGHKLDDLYIGFQLIRWLPQEFQSFVQQIYRWKEEDFRVVKIKAELILEANRLQLMKQDLEKAENAYLSSFTSKKSKTFPGATAAAHGDPNGKKDYQKKGGPPTKKWAGVNAVKSDGSGESSVRGLELRQASICINRVEHSSKLRSTELVAFISNCLALLIADSHKPPKCGVYGGMKDHSIPLRERKFCTSSCRHKSTSFLR